MVGSEGQIGRPQPHQPVDRIGPLGRASHLLGSGKFALERGEGAGVHCENQVIEVGDHVVDGADRTAGLIGQRTRLQATEALGLDRAFGGGNQRVSQPLPAFGGRRHRCVHDFV